MPRPIWERWIDPDDPEEVLHLALTARELVITHATPAEFCALARTLRRAGFDLPWLPKSVADDGRALSGAERVALCSLRRRIIQLLDAAPASDRNEEVR